MAAWLEAAWLARYLERALTGEEVAWFEAYALDKPHLIAAIERDSDLRDAVHAARLDADLTTTDAHADPEPAQSARSPRRALPLAMAATIVASVLGVMVGRNLAGETSPAADADPLVVHVEATRGASSGARIDAGSARSRTALLEIVIPPGTTHLEARLGSLVVEREVDGAETLATLVVPVDALATRTLVLRLQQQGPSSEREIALPELPDEDPPP